MRIMKTPKSVGLNMTDRCNLRCKYCGYFTSASNTGMDLPKEEWFEFFEELNRCSVMDVCLSGGEPFCREDITEIIEKIVSNRMRFRILSNGSLITDETAAFLSSTGHCNGVQVSIDSSIPVDHDAFRGKGSFFKAVQGIERMRKHGVPVQVRVTIHKKNVHNLEGVASLLLEEIGLPGFSTCSANYMGLCQQNAEEVRLSVEERSLAMKTLLELSKKYNGRINAAAGPLAEGREWTMMDKCRRQGQKYRPGRGFLSGCGGVMSKIDVRADGVMVPCTQLGHIELGRINRDDLQEIWQHHPELKRLRERRTTPLSSFEFCKGCDYIDYCTGGCPAAAYSSTGDDNHPDPNSCIKRFLDEGGTLPDEGLLLTPRVRSG